MLEEGERRKRECYGNASATGTRGCPVSQHHAIGHHLPRPQSLFLVVLFLIPTPKPSPFSSPFPLYATSWIQVAVFISGLLLHMLYGSRERASGRQSTRMGNSSGAARTQQSPGRGVALYQPCFSSSTPHCFSPAPGPFALKGKWEEGQWWGPTATASLGGPLGFRTLSQTSPRCITQGEAAGEAAVSQREVALFAVVAQRKRYSQLLSAHETFVGVLLARGIPNRVILPRAGQSSTSFKLGAILTAVILRKEDSS